MRYTEDGDLGSCRKFHLVVEERVHSMFAKYSILFGNGVGKSITYE
jgi:hypothetical protein